MKPKINLREYIELSEVATSHTEVYARDWAKINSLLNTLAKVVEDLQDIDDRKRIALEETNLWVLHETTRKELEQIELG